MSPSEQRVIKQTRHWVKEVVIGLNLCPFAASVFKENSITYRVMQDSDMAAHLQQLADCLAELDIADSIETSLLIYPESYRKFDDYLDFLELANRLLEELDYTGIYQLASFHPDYLFADSTAHDPGNYTNRSPFPMLHLLRESSIEKAVSSYPGIELVPDNNIKKLNAIGVDKMQSIISQLLEEQP